MLHLVAVEAQTGGGQAVEQVIEEDGAERLLGFGPAEIDREHLVRLHCVHLADAKSARVIGENAVAKHVGEHPFGAVGDDVGEPLIVVFLVAPA